MGQEAGSRPTTKKKKKKDKKQPCCSEATSTAQRKKKRIHGCLSPNSIRFLFSPSKKMMATRSRPSSKDDPRWLISVQVHNLSVDTELGNGGSATVKVHLWILPADSEPTESAGDAIHMTSKRKSPTLRVSPSGMSEPRTWRLSSSQIWRFSGDGDTPLRIQRLVLLTLTPTCC
jgi:hypothetical protein